LFGCTLFMAACQDAEAARQDRVHDMMADVMQPAAEGVWDHAGFILTAEGEESLYPTTEEGWEEVANNARNLITLAEDLKSPDYAPDQDAWADYADGVILASEEIIRAAATREEQRIFDAGGVLYNACLGCHNRYIVEAEQVIQ
jgi:hypothetical protein